MEGSYNTKSSSLPTTQKRMNHLTRTMGDSSGYGNVILGQPQLSYGEKRQKKDESH